MTVGVKASAAVSSANSILELREKLRSEIHRIGEDLCNLAEVTDDDDQSFAALYAEMKPLLSKVQGIYDNLGTTLKGCHAVASVAAIGLFGFTAGWTPALEFLAA